MLIYCIFGRLLYTCLWDLYAISLFGLYNYSIQVKYSVLRCFAVNWQTYFTHILDFLCNSFTLKYQYRFIYSITTGTEINSFLCYRELQMCPEILFDGQNRGELCFIDLFLWLLFFFVIFTDSSYLVESRMENMDFCGFVGEKYIFTMLKIT